MHTIQQLPDAMPDLTQRMLILVCDSQHARFIDVGNHTLVLHSTVEDEKAHYSDNEGRTQSPAAGGKGGMVSGLNDPSQEELHRLKHFANLAVRHMETIVLAQNIQEIYISAPAKFLHELRRHIPKSLAAHVKGTLEGNFIREPMKDVLLRFRPDLAEAVATLREEENYSAKKHLPQ